MTHSIWGHLNAVLRRQLKDYFEFETPERKADAVNIALDDLGVRLGRAKVARYQLTKERAALHSDGPHLRAALIEEAEDAIAGGAPEMARAALTLKADLDERVSAVDRLINGLTHEIEDLARLIADLREELREGDDDLKATGARLRDRLEALRAEMAEMGNDKEKTD